MDLAPLYLSAKLAFITTFVLLICATPVAFLMAFKSFKGKFVLESLIGLPLVVPPTVLGFYLLLVMGNNGFLGRFWTNLTGWPLAFTFAGLVVASVVYSFPFAVQPIKASFEKIDLRLLEMAKVLGLSDSQTFFKIALPNASNGICAAAILVFAHTMGEFGVILMVGGSIPNETKVASIAIYEYVENMQYQEAAALSLVMVIGSYLILLLVNYLNSGLAAKR